VVSAELANAVHNTNVALVEGAGSLSHVQEPEVSLHSLGILWVNEDACSLPLFN